MDRLEYFKKELLKVLEKKDKTSVSEIVKCIAAEIAKGGKVGAVGEIRIWKGKKFKKMPNKKWVRVYDTQDKHTENSIARLKGKVRRAQSVEELFQIVMNNTHRFSDENGKPLDIVLELKKEVDTRKKYLNREKPAKKKGGNGGNGGDEPPKVNRFISQNPNARLVSDITDIEKKEVIDNLKKPVASVEHGIIKKNENDSVMTVASKYVGEHFKDPAKTKIGDVEISKKGMKNDLSHGFGKDKLDAIPALKDVLEKGAYIGYANDSEGRPVNHHYFAGKVHFPDGDKIVFCRVHENKGDKINHFYVHEVFLEDDLKKEKDFLQDRATPMVGKRGEIPFIQSVLQEVLNVNEKDEKSERAEAVKKYIEDKLNEYMNDSYTKSSAYGFIKKYGKKRLEEIANGNVKSDGDYKKWLSERIESIENENGEEVSESTIDTAIWKHCVAFYEREAAREKLKSMDANEKTLDLPVDEKDMQEAENIIGADVKRILDGRDAYGNTKQTLTDKIKRRVRNNPAVARAMLVYIKQEQERTGKKVYTEKHSIWEELPKLNENAKEAAKKGESETKTGVSGNLYEGSDGTTVVENKDWGRYQISFPGKPDGGTISVLKHNGFRWSPSTKTWVAYNTANGERSLKAVAEKLGLKKTGEVEKSIALRVADVRKSFFESFGQVRTS